MRLLAIETTCDETGVAVLEGPSPEEPWRVPRIRSSVVASQLDLHQRYGGVVPEIAARAHVRQILPVLRQALRESGVGLEEIGAVAVATRPGLVGALVVGLTVAKTLAWSLEVPLVEVDHLEGHLFACQLAFPERVAYPCVGLVVSGGHTSLYRCDGPIDATPLGGTIDDAAGEAFDKVASLLGLGYPGGPRIEALARSGNPRRFALPRSFLKEEERLEFSFSGLKTAVLYTLQGQPGPPSHPPEPSSPPPPEPGFLADLAASFQEAVVEVLVTKAAQATRRTGLRRLAVGGGVAANQRFREALEQMATREGIDLLIAPPALCTDNAAMAGVAFAKLQRGLVAPLDIDVTPGLVRPSRPSPPHSSTPPTSASCPNPGFSLDSPPRTNRST
ncbi:O-sialoglycoprotein endopeptidase [Isosphaera pallida ATCC 43644]|uniref:tRNA N6-adenosine threonylcarbamoyltransferase n=1 Tax=Isosphaera pallida (strain ATCC 43644 / DSM 9630 / IS1B) TaxID=575540 RepID=E8QX84_ISOPI|nr:tRNA (adenosine(37)-N6)-threonylcarbamoyltransferase complex transferase subunit TsaD [Isosphaera pallida]ADV60917.1 O-sialoglycoprotein endopeptidase [Isosphaera pallida ATCC 43644]